jgi:CBS-domain-containing membrane protein
MGISMITPWLRTRAVPAVLAGSGAFLALWALAATGKAAALPLVIAPFGASSVLLFALPGSPLAQPRNVIGGHLLSAAIGLVVLALVGSGPLALGLGVGLAIAAMQITGTTHPPAGANPIVVLLTGATWKFLFLPVMAGAVMLVVAARLYRAAVSR